MPPFDRLLVVDDDQGQLRHILEIARESGFREVLQASSEHEATDLIDSQRFGLAVVDLMLSQPPNRYEGLRVIAELRRKQPHCRIIALTTRGRNDGGIRALREGADDFVCGDWKYINWRELLRQRLDLWRGVAESEHTVGAE